MADKKPEFERFQKNFQQWSKNAGESVRTWGQKTAEGSKKAGEGVREWADTFQWQVDRDNVDDSMRELGAKIRGLVQQGRYTKIRIKFKGKQLGPDIPMGVFLAGEVAAAWWAGPLGALVVTLGARTVLDIELVHEASSRVREGVDYFMDGEVELAEERYREALRMKPGDTAALYNLGVVLRVTGRRDEAKECFERASQDEEHPDGARAREALGRMSRRK